MKALALAVFLSGCGVVQPKPAGVCETLFQSFPPGQHMAGTIKAELPVMTEPGILETSQVQSVYCIAWALPHQVPE